MLLALFAALAPGSFAIGAIGAERPATGGMWQLDVYAVCASVP